MSETLRIPSLSLGDVSEASTSSPSVHLLPYESPRFTDNEEIASFQLDIGADVPADHEMTASSATASASRSSSPRTINSTRNRNIAAIIDLESLRTPISDSEPAHVRMSARSSPRGPSVSSGRSSPTGRTSPRSRSGSPRLRSYNANQNPEEASLVLPQHNMRAVSPRSSSPRLENHIAVDVEELLPRDELAAATTLLENIPASPFPEDLQPYASQSSMRSSAQLLPTRRHHNLRLQLEQFFENYGLLLSCSATAILVAATTYGWLTEDNFCNLLIPLWLATAAIRSLLVALVKVSGELIHRDLLPFYGNKLKLEANITRIINLCDLAGIVWICVGTVLLLPSIRPDCAFKSPMIHFTSVAYVMSVYLCLFCKLVITVIRYSCPSDIDVVRSLLDDAQTMPTSTDWKAWLESYGCMECEYAAEEADRDVDNRACAICLCDFLPAAAASVVSEDEVSLGSRSMTAAELKSVAPFPCAARHIFHVRCLHRWLNAASTTASSPRSRANITCPLCRQLPSNTTTTRSDHPHHHHHSNRDADTAMRQRRVEIRRHRMESRSRSRFQGFILA
jgi:hypothetical protein